MAANGAVARMGRVCRLRLYACELAAQSHPEPVRAAAMARAGILRRHRLAGRHEEAWAHWHEALASFEQLHAADAEVRALLAKEPAEHTGHA